MQWDDAQEEAAEAEELEKAKGNVYEEPKTKIEEVEGVDLDAIMEEVEDVDLVDACITERDFLTAIFDVIDHNNNGFVTMLELKAKISLLGHTKEKTLADVEKMF